MDSTSPKEDDITKEDFNDYEDCDFINLFFSVMIIIYIVALMIFFAGPISETPNNDNVRWVAILWSIINKPLLALVTVFFVVFNITAVPLTFLLTSVGVLSMINTIIFIVGLLYNSITCNEPTRPNNICNSFERCCVFYNVINSGCNITDGPCSSDFPSTVGELGANDSFIFFWVMVIILFICEVLIVALSLIIRQNRLSHEAEFFKYKKLIDLNTDTRGSIPTNKVTTKVTQFKNMSMGVSNMFNRFLKRTMDELGKIPSDTGLTGSYSNNLLDKLKNHKKTQ
jgi:hypothetical protein